MRNTDSKDKQTDPRELVRTGGEKAMEEANKAAQRSSFKTEEEEEKKDFIKHRERREDFRHRKDRVPAKEREEKKEAQKTVFKDEEREEKKEQKREQALHKAHMLSDTEHADAEKRKRNIKNMIKDMREAVRGKGREVAEDRQYVEAAAEKGAATVQNAYSNVQEASNFEKSDFTNGKEDDYFKKGTEVGILDREDEDTDQKRYAKEEEMKMKEEREKEKEREKARKKMGEFVKDAALFSAFDKTADDMMKNTDDPEILGTAYGELLKDHEKYQDVPGAFKKLQYVYDRLELGRPAYEKAVEKEISGNYTASALKDRIVEDRDMERGDE